VDKSYVHSKRPEQIRKPLSLTDGVLVDVGFDSLAWCKEMLGVIDGGVVSICRE
jgi:hypothetical protein